jgi:hypothetical protein
MPGFWFESLHHHHSEPESPSLPRRPTVDSRRVAIEVGTATVAAALVSPVVAIIDKAIIKQVAGVQVFVEAIGEGLWRMATHPRLFFTSAPFVLTYGVYAGTYLAANLAEAAMDYVDERHGAERKTVKVALASTANIGLLLGRDAYMARMFRDAPPAHGPASGASSAAAAPPYPKAVPKTPFPPFRTLWKFAVRDATTMAATFYAAPLFGKWMLDRGHVETTFNAEVIASLSVPVVANVCSAPLHILALDQYNRPSAESRSRWEHMRRELRGVTFARCLRVVPAFGLGSFSNTQLRRYLLGKAEDS